MNVELETTRLQLVPIRETDFESFSQILRDASVRRYLCDDRLMEDNEISEMILVSQLSFQNRKYGLWFIVEKASQQIIGFVGLWVFFAEAQPQLSYALLSPFTGRGFATEASRRIIDYCFEDLGFTYLTASCDRPNLTSQKVLLRLGMQKFKEETINGMPLIFYTIDRMD